MPLHAHKAPTWPPAAAGLGPAFRATAPEPVQAQLAGRFWSIPGDRRNRRDTSPASVAATAPSLQVSREQASGALLMELDLTEDPLGVSESGSLETSAITAVDNMDESMASDVAVSMIIGGHGARSRSPDRSRRTPELSRRTPELTPSTVHGEGLCNDTQLLLPPDGELVSRPPTPPGSHRAQPRPVMGGPVVLGGASGPTFVTSSEESLEAWCAANGLSEAVLGRLREEQFVSPKHLAHLEPEDMKALVQGCRMGEKYSFYHAIHLLREAMGLRSGSSQDG